MIRTFRLANRVRPSSLSSKSRWLSNLAGSSTSTNNSLDEETDLSDFRTLHELQVKASKRYAQNELFGTYNPSTENFDYMTYAEYGNKVDQCRQVLRSLGVKEYDKVGIIANNRWEWPVIAAAAYSINAALVPMYEAQLPSDWRYILNDSGASVVFCATSDIHERVTREVLPSVPGVEAFCLEDVTGAEYEFSTLMDRVTAAEDSTGRLASITVPTEEDLADLIYTSGTTGRPKGVELTHLNLSSNVKGAKDIVARDFATEEDRSLAFLPWAHSYGQTVELWMGIRTGGSLGICRGVTNILDDLAIVKPTILFAVPTLYKKVYDGVQNLIESSSPTRSNLMRTALQLGHENAEYKKGLRGPLGFMDRMKFAALDRLVLSKIRDKFGGRLRYGCVAGAACPTEVLNFMDSLGIPVLEGYGLTETSPIITINAPKDRLVGSVGRAITDVTVYIVDEDGNPVKDGEEGEICCVGPNVMRGYYNNQEATDEVISIAPDGKSRMFHTGDLGRMDTDGWVKVTGRLKEQYKLENGKYVVPTPIENAIGMSRFISQVVLCGANRPYNIALIVPEWTAIRGELGLSDDDTITEEEIANDVRVKDLIDTEITASCYKLKKFEVPQSWAFVAPFTAANNMLTPKMSIRRHKVMEAYEDIISHLYGDDPIVTEAADGTGSTAATTSHNEAA